MGIHLHLQYFLPFFLLSAACFTMPHRFFIVAKHCVRTFSIGSSWEHTQPNIHYISKKRLKVYIDSFSFVLIILFVVYDFLFEFRFVNSNNSNKLVRRNSTVSIYKQIVFSLSSDLSSIIFHMIYGWGPFFCAQLPTFTFNPVQVNSFLKNARTAPTKKEKSDLIP